METGRRASRRTGRGGTAGAADRRRRNRLVSDLRGDDDPAIELSPGTSVFHDSGYGRHFPDLQFTPAALLLTRVDQPADGRTASRSTWATKPSPAIRPRATG